MNEQEPVSADAPAGQVGTKEAPASTVTEVTSAAEAQLSAPVSATAATAVASVAAAAPESPASVTAAPPAAPEPTPATAVSTDVAAKDATTSLPLSEEDYGAAPQTFAEMALADDIHQALLAMGFTEPLPVQRRVY